MNEISLQDIFRYSDELWRFIKRKFITLMVFGLIGGALGLTYAFLKKPVYKGFMSFLVNENESSQINLSSLAGLAGLGNMGGGAVNEDKLLFLTSSRYIVGSTLLSESNIDGHKIQLANHFIDVYKLRKGFESDTALKGFTSFRHTIIDSLTYQENKVLDAIIKMITDAKLIKVEVKKKTGIVAQNAGIVTVEFTSKNEQLSKSFLDNMYGILSTYYVNKTIQRQLRNYNLIKERADSLKLILSDKEYAGAAFVDQNLNIAKMAARVKVERTRRDLELLNLMYAEVLKNLEIAKFSLENQTPLLQQVDHPTYPLKMEKTSKLLSLILGGILMGVIAFVFLVLKEYRASTKKDVNAA